MIQIQARFFDGRTAAEQWVGVTIESGGLRLLGASGQSEAEWPFAELELLPGAVPPPLRLRLRSLPDARLVIEDLTAIAAITPKLPRGKDDPTLRLFLIGGLATAVIVASLWFLAPIATRLAASLVPASLEAKWGERASVEIFSQAKRCEAAEGARLLEQLIARLADANPLARGWRFEAAVLQDAMVNAFALPGGRIVIMEGLLKQAKSPDEVAGVLAHEMGHVIARHAVERMIWRQAVDFGLGLLFGGGGGGGASMAQLLINQSHSREAEREADRLALALLTQAGISTDGFAAFFERQAATAPKLPGAELLGYLLSHPPDPERSAAAKAARTPVSKPALSDEEWRTLQNICAVRSQG
jgi:predicted Zn-dependent protease